MATAPLETLWYTRCPVPTGLGIALQQGWLEQEIAPLGTRVASLRESAGTVVRNSHFDHSQAYSVRHGGSIPAIWARASGRETRVLGLSWADETQRILVRQDSDIVQVRDLVGRRFGLPHWHQAGIDFTRAQALRGLENALRLEGLKVDDVERVDYLYRGSFSDRPPHAPTATADASSWPEGRHRELVGLLRGEVDAIFLKGADAALQARTFGLRTLIDTGIHPDPLIRSNNGTPRTLTVDSRLPDEHPDVAAAILKVVMRAERWAEQHPDETRIYLARETDSSENLVRVAYGTDAHLRLRTNLNEQSLLALQDFVDFLHRWAFIPQRFDVRAWIAPHLEEALPPAPTYAVR